MPVFYVTVDSTGAVTGCGRAENAVNNLGRSFDDMRNKGKSGTDAVASSLSNLAKKAVAVVAGYQALAKISASVRIGNAYNSQLEDAQLGIATIIASTQQLVGEQGQILQGQEAFNKAQKMSVDMAKALDVASMKSTASYGDLLSSFQTTLSTTNQMKLSWQETLDINIKMSNVLKSLNIPMENLARETQRMLTGHDLLHSQVAQRLNISKKEIESWGKGAQYFENFQKKFEQMGYAGDTAEKTYSAVVAYYEDVLQSLSAEIHKGQFDAWKKSMLEVADAFYEIDEATKTFKVRDEMRDLVQLGQDVSTAFGETALSGVQSFMSGLQGVSGFIGDNKEAVYAWGSAAASSVGYLASATAAVILVRTVQAAKMPAFIASELAYQRALLGTATASKVSMAAAVSLGVARHALLATLGGPVGVAMAAGAVAMYAFGASETDAEKGATLLQKALAGLNPEIKNTSDIAKQAAENIGAMSAAQLLASLPKMKAALEKQRSELSGNADASFMGGMSFAFDDKKTLAEQQITKLREQMASGAIELEVFKKRMEDIAKANPALAELVVTIIEQAEAFQKSAIAVAEAENKTKEFSEATKQAAFDIDSIREAALRARYPLTALFSLSQASEFSSSLDALQFKIDQLGRGKAEQAVFDMLHQDKSLNLKELEGKVEIGHDGKFKPKNGLFVKPEDLDLLNRYLDKQHEYTGKLEAQRAKEKAVADAMRDGQAAFKEREAALRSLDDETNRLLMSERQYAEEQIKMKAAAWREKGLPEEKVKAFEDAGIAGLNKKRFDESRKYLTDFELQYQQVMGSISATTTSVMMEMEQYRTLAEDAFNKGLITEQQRLEVLQRIDKMQAQKLVESSRKMEDGTSRALKKIYEDSTNLGMQFENFTSSTFGSLEDSIVETAWGAKDAWEDAGKSILKMLAHIAVQQGVIAPISGMFGSMFSGFSTAHDGGVAGVAMTGRTYASPLAFLGAPRYHDGGVAGLKPGEVPAILRYGEPVFTPEQASTLAPLADIQAMLERTGGPSSGGVVIQQNFYNEFTIDGTGKNGEQISQDISKSLMKNLEQGMRAIAVEAVMDAARPGGPLNPRGGYN